MRIKVLGPVEVEDAGAPLVIGGPQQRRLLALLVLHRGRVVSSDRIVDALWPDGDPPEAAARSIRTYLSRLRAVLRDGAITTQPSGYVLVTDGLALDLEEFDGLLDEADHALPDVALGCYDRALGLWRGVPFGDLGDEWWAVPEVARLTERRAAAEEGRATALMAIGHHERAIPDLERLVAEHPLRERPVQLLAQALHATGRRAEALRAVRAFRARLAEETGLDPSGELAELESSLLADDDLPGGSADRPLRGYTLHRAIGEGAHGRVYEATQPGTDRRVAIKVIRPELADSTDFVRRFEAEARLVARLEHPHIVPLYDYWREPGGAYLVFRLLTGGTAREAVVSGGPWSVPRVSRLVEEVGGALISAHAAGVTHNDVRASNILLDGDGAAYLTDFGIAVVGDDPIARDEAERADLRDLAWVIWELLTGSCSSAEHSRRAAGARSRVLPSLIGRVDSVPEGLDAVLSGSSAGDGAITSVAELVLAWRAATGHLEGARSPVTSSDRRAADSRADGGRRGSWPSPPARGSTRTEACGRSTRPMPASSTVGRPSSTSSSPRSLTEPLVTVVGASGSGKSSVVRAGLVPRLRAQGRVVVTMVPTEDPLGALREALAEVATTPDVDELVAPVEALGRIAARLGPLVVVIDQLEELWTRSSADRRDAFLDGVATVIEDGSVDVRFVATVRADLLDRPLEHPRLGPAVGLGAFVLSPLSPAELDAAIVVPAGEVGVAIEEGVVADLVAEAATHPGSLPLLQFTLTELYDRRSDGVIGPGALEAVGGMAGAIGRRAEEVHRSLGDVEQADARRLFTRLVAPGDGSPDTRRRAPQSELSAGMRSVAARFVEARLLVTDRDPATREPTVEVAHEALLSRWSRLAGWVDEDRRWLATAPAPVRRGADVGRRRAARRRAVPGGSARGSDRVVGRRGAGRVASRGRVRRGRPEGARRRGAGGATDSGAVAASAHRGGRGAGARPPRGDGGVRPATRGALGGRRGRGRGALGPDRGPGRSRRGVARNPARHRSPARGRGPPALRHGAHPIDPVRHVHRRRALPRRAPLRGRPGHQRHRPARRRLGVPDRPGRTAAPLRPRLRRPALGTPYRQWVPMTASRCSRPRRRGTSSRWRLGRIRAEVRPPSG